MAALAITLAAAPFATLTAGDANASGPVTWKFDNLVAVQGHPLTVIGDPRVQTDGAIAAVWFDGVRDGLNVPDNPIVGWGKFTVAVLIRPDPDGQPEQRFFHIQQTDPASRVLVEIRLTPQGNWSLDTYLQSGTSEHTLLDRTKQHPAGQWYWVALEYDGAKMRSFVDGINELEGDVAFPPMISGKVSAGVRMNRVFWFKGRIAEARFFPSVLAPSDLPRER